MMHATHSPGPVTTLRRFYERMARTRTARMALVHDVLQGQTPDAGAVEALAHALADLAAIPAPGGGAALDDAAPRSLLLDSGAAMELSLGYEIGELRKDLLYLDKGEAALLEYMTDIHPRFKEQLHQGVETLGRRDYRCLVSDRDGTVNNYCGRYRSSVQSVYNAVFLTLFAKSRAEFPVILTSAPLSNIGIVEISCAPEGVFVYAGSKGREFQDQGGALKRKAVDPERQAMLDKLNKRLEALLAEPGYGVFGLIGSGLQFKFGQTTVARQDVNGTVSHEDSQAFLGTVRGLVRDLDPGKKYFRIEDTGLDVEVILTVEDGSSGLKDFDKGDGVRYLDQALCMGLERGPHLVCGDTGSDVPMLEAALEATPDVHAVFVTSKPELIRRVRSLRKDAVIVDQPDVLVAMLRQLA